MFAAVRATPARQTSSFPRVQPALQPQQRRREEEEGGDAETVPDLIEGDIAIPEVSELIVLTAAVTANIAGQVTARGQLRPLPCKKVEEQHRALPDEPELQ